MTNKYIFLPSKEGQQWVREKETMPEPSGFSNRIDKGMCKPYVGFQNYLDSLKSYLFEGPPGKLGEEVEGELVYQWYSRDKNGWIDMTQEMYQWPYEKSGRREIVRAIQPAKAEDPLKEILMDIVVGLHREMGSEWCTKLANRISSLKQQ
jgi:hypothetical protein